MYGICWKQAPHEKVWIRAFHPWCYVWLDRLEEISDMTAKIAGYVDGMDTDFNALLLAPGHQRIVVKELHEATVWIDKLLRRHKTLRLNSTWNDRRVYILDAITPKDDRIGVVWFTHQARYSNIKSMGFSQAEIRGGTVYIQGWIVFESGGTVHPSRNFKGRGTTFRAAIANAYENVNE